MSQEQDATFSGLKIALKMEEDGKAFYLKAAKLSKNKIGTQLFKNLAAEEDIHREIFKNIYNNIKNKKQWPDVKFESDHGHKLKTLFAAEMENMGKNFTPAKAELDAVKTGMDMENKTLDFYRERAGKTSLDAEKELYESLAMQESEHSRILREYYEFYLDPASFYLTKEHRSVDGG